jgi:hypothetical protein
MPKIVRSAALLSLLLAGCLGEFQDHDVVAPEQPYYTLYGHVLDEASGAVVPFVEVTISMTYSFFDNYYEGGWIDQRKIMSDSLGQYQFDSLYLGQYLLQTYEERNLVYSNQIDFILYSDREFDIIIPEADHQLSGQITDCDSFELLEGVSVFLTPRELWNGAVMDPLEVQTSSSGQYIFKEIFPGDYRLQAFRQDLYPQEQNIRIREEPEKRIEIDFCMRKYVFE